MNATPASRSAVPYFCQWESAHRASEIIQGTLALADDPAWRGSGARDVDEYARWASHVCGMACLKMVLAARDGRQYPTLELARGSLAYGAYTVEGEQIKGMIYAPFVRYVDEAFGLAARVHVDLRADELPGLMSQAAYFMALDTLARAATAQEGRAPGAGDSRNAGLGDLPQSFGGARHAGRCRIAAGRLRRIFRGAWRGDTPRRERLSAAAFMACEGRSLARVQALRARCR
ncbi:hypothetical protein LMG26854_05480 [Achromobacter aegrifaciens]|uniref:hypothetical protein n=1 Tax=Achromobacter aegrifaciens TaxID=1287736 RepID=UPI0014682B3B|nr:hypothetical protein [Achromobacter aegrifaciens]CAB3900568.1 hypothetical protein LMG26854_05480 [Achromobacter aegrifaciens]